MSEISGHCEICLNRSNPNSIRVFPCLYHCKKMLCIEHLSEHDQYIEKQIEYQKELEILWRNYDVLFNEKKIFDEFLQLKLKLQKFQALKQEVKNLLLIKHFQESTENNQRFQKAIQIVTQAMKQENQALSMTHNIDPKIECDMSEDDYDHDDDETEEYPRTIDDSSLSSSMATNDESGSADCLPSISDINGNSPLDDESDDYENSIAYESEDKSLSNFVNKNETTSITPNRKVVASKFRGCCPLTHDGAFGISVQIHGIRLCPNKSREHAREYRLHRHLCGLHHLTSFASLSLCRAIMSGQDPLTTRLFSDHHIILNMDELRSVNCPITKSFHHYPSLKIAGLPCQTIKQVRHLKDHLRRVHNFTNLAANFIMKSMKTNKPIEMIEFPQWIDIIQFENLI